MNYQFKQLIQEMKRNAIRFEIQRVNNAIKEHKLRLEELKQELKESLDCSQKLAEENEEKTLPYLE